MNSLYIPISRTEFTALHSQRQTAGLTSEDLSSRCLEIQMQQARTSLYRQCSRILDAP